MKMKRTKPIKNNSAFRNVYAKASSASNRLLVLYFQANGSETNYLGVTVSKKVGGAVVRNRVKRLIKESYRLSENLISAGYDLVVVARVSAGKLDRAGSYSAIDGALKALLAKQGLLVK